MPSWAWWIPWDAKLVEDPVVRPTLPSRGPPDRQSGEGQLRAPPRGAAAAATAASAAARTSTAAFGASATADGAAGKAYRNMLRSCRGPVRASSELRRAAGRLGRGPGGGPGRGPAAD